MFIFLFLFAIFNRSSSAPVLTHDDIDPINHLTFFGRDLPECMNIKRFRTKGDIIWSCLTTIFACTWVAVHPNLPDERKSGWKLLRMRMFTMVSALVAPEVIVILAMRQRIGAAKHAAEYNDKFFPGLNPLSWIESIKQWFRGSEDDRTDGRWTLTHGFLLEMNGLKVDGETLHNVSSLTKPIEVREDEINDKSKGDFLTKLVAVLQTAWFIIQCLARWTTHLPVTELEVVTLSFAALNVATYVLWWNKPQNMHVPMRVRKDGEVEFRQDWRKLVEDARGKADDVSENGNPKPHQGLVDSIKQWMTEDLVKFGRVLFHGAVHCMFAGAMLTIMVSFYWLAIPVGLCVTFVLIPSLVILPVVGMPPDDHGIISSAFYSSKDTLNNMKTLMSVSILSAVFGVIHLIPVWTISFATSTEKLL